MVDADTFTKAELRQLLSLHNISSPQDASKLQLAATFTEALPSIRRLTRLNAATYHLTIARPFHLAP